MKCGGILSPLSATLVGEHYLGVQLEIAEPLSIFLLRVLGMTKKVAVMLDGGHCRVCTKVARKKYDPDFIEKIGLACAQTGDEIYRILYYDCATYSGTVKLPASGDSHTFTGNDTWLIKLAQRNLFAVRRGELKFRGYIPRTIPIAPSTPLTDSDFKPVFEQKGVDMRIGLDMAIFSEHKSVDIIALATNDTDCIAAMKHVRRSGVQVALVTFANCKPASGLLAHSDFNYQIDLSSL